MAIFIYTSSSISEASISLSLIIQTSNDPIVLSLTLTDIIEELFEENYKSLVVTGLRPLSPKQKNSALEQIITYFKENYNELQRVVEAEVDVSIEKDDYILKGKINIYWNGWGIRSILKF